MMRFTTDNGELVQGSSPTEVLMDLKNGSLFDSDRELDDYLEDLVLRLRDFYGTLITSDDHADLILDLISIGFLKPVK
jgi:hypothetical protein